MFQKNLLPALVFGMLFFQSPASALSMGVGVKGGVNLANADVDGIDDTENRTGAAAGIMAEVGVTNPLSLLVEALYLQRGAQGDILGVEAEADIDYLEVPILLKAKFGKTAAHAYLIAGPSLGFKLTSEGRYVGFEDELEENFSSFNFSGDIGLGGAFQVSKFVYLSADARYSHGFTDAIEESIGSIDSWNSRDIRLMAGVLFHLTE